jgi:hypothetical protein
MKRSTKSTSNPGAIHVARPERSVTRASSLRRWTWFALAGGTLLAMASAARADSGNSFSFPIVDSILCGFWSYSKTRLAPMIAAIVVLFSVVGQWLGHGRMWAVLLYIGLGLGIILGIGALIATQTGVGASCLSN